MDHTEPEPESSGKRKYNPNWGTHWHARVMDPTNIYRNQFIQLLQSLYDEGYLHYVALYEEEKHGRPHFHIGLGTNKSYNKYQLAGKLRFRPMPLGSPFSNWYLAPIYSESTPQKNLQYIRKDGRKLLDIGEVPEDRNITRAQETQKEKDDKWAEIVTLAKQQKWEEIENRWPYHMVQYGAKLKAQYFIQHEPTDRSHNEHLWVYGPPGTGKSAVVEYLFPRHFKKRADEDWIGYNPSLEPGHKVVYLGDFDQISMQRLKAERLKVMCDPQGFNANKKYAGGDMIAPGRIVITSNYRIGQCFPPGYPGIEEALRALRRRFREVHIHIFLAEHGLTLKTKPELKQLRDDQNFDFGKCFNHNVEQPEIIDLCSDSSVSIKRERSSTMDSLETHAAEPIYETEEESSQLPVEMVDKSTQVHLICGREMQYESEEELSVPLFDVPPPKLRRLTACVIKHNKKYGIDSQETLPPLSQVQ